MNQRIRTFAEQAGYLPDSFGVGHWDMPECKKFAELIVRECATLIPAEQSHAPNGQPILKIFQEHFEIET